VRAVGASMARVNVNAAMDLGNILWGLGEGFVVYSLGLGWGCDVFDVGR